MPFTPGRTDAVQEQTDVSSFGALEPRADGFRNYYGGDIHVESEKLLVDRAQLLTLSAPEMSVLLAGLRVLGANYDNSLHGVFTDKPQTLSNDFFVNVLNPNIQWSATSKAESSFEGRDRKTGAVKYTGTRVDLVFGSNSQLRALAEVYASDGNEQQFINDFVSAWHKVMELDRFDLK